MSWSLVVDDGGSEDTTTITVLGDSPEEATVMKMSYTNGDGDLVELSDRLGKGSFGEVYAATVDGFVPIVVKVSKLTEGGQSMVALNEVEKLKLLGYHQQVPYYYSHTTIGKFLYLEISRAGMCIADAIASRSVDQKPFPLKTVCAYATEIMKALEFIHGKSLVHLDVKCSNICLSLQNDSLILVDFGSALFLNELEHKRRRIRTLAYMSPELLLRLSLGTPTDLWSAAVVVYRLYSGEYPFRPLHQQNLFRMMYRNRLLPPNVLTSPLYDEYMQPIMKRYEWDEPLFDSLIDEAFIARAKSKFLTREEEQFGFLAMQLFEPDPVKRPTASAFAKKLEDFYDSKIFDWNHPFQPPSP